MEELVKKALIDDLFQQVILFYDIEYLGGLKNLVYEDVSLEKEYLLRIGHSSHRQKEENTFNFLKNVCKGYSEETNLDYSWIDHTNDFLKHRELLVHIVIHSAGEEVLNSNWAHDYIKIFKNRIFNDIHFFDYKKTVGII